MFITLVIMLGDSVLSLFSVFPVHVQLIQDLERLEETNAPRVSELCLALCVLRSLLLLDISSPPDTDSIILFQQHWRL